jgi:HlyD family secretion protein
MSRKRRIVGLVAIVTVVVALTSALAHFRQTAGDWVIMDDGPWTAPVVRGSMVWDIRGAGTLIQTQNSSKLFARVTVPDNVAGGLRLSQKVDVDTRNSILQGHTVYISPSPSNGMRSADIAVKSRLPKDFDAGQEVDATIHLGTIENILYVCRPVHAYQYSTIPVFKVVDDGQRAVRVVVKFGRASVNAIEVLDGLKQGDKIIPSAMSAWDNFDQIKLK